MIDFCRFLESPKSFYNLLSSSSTLKGRSGIEPVYLSFTLSFTGIGDVQAFSFSIPQGYQAFLWLLGYYAVAALRGNLSGLVTIDGRTIYGDATHLRPEFTGEFSNFEPVEGVMAGTWVTTAVVAAGSQLSVIAHGMLLKSGFYLNEIVPCFEGIASDMVGG